METSFLKRFKNLKNEKYVFEAVSSLQNEKNKLLNRFQIHSMETTLLKRFQLKKNMFLKCFQVYKRKNTFLKRFSSLQNQKTHV